MKNIVKQIALAVIIATAATSAQAGIKEFQDTLASYWKSTCSTGAQAKNATKNFFVSTKNFFASNWFFATNLHTLKNIAAKLNKPEVNDGKISPEEYTIACTAIGYSTLSVQDKRNSSEALKLAREDKEKKEVESKRAAAVSTAPSAPEAPAVTPAPATLATTTPASYPLQSAIENLEEIIKEKQNEYITATAGVMVGLAGIYAYKRYTARPSIPGWCS